MEALAPRAIGRYELLIELGRGGMAVLYLARAQGVGGFSRLFAIKQILPHLAVDPTFVEMFLNEGRIAARLSHPNLCPVFELGQERGELFLVMEYLDGVPWEALARAAPRDARGLALTAGVLAQACEGLHHAHTFRDVDGTPTPIIHRDVSPQNLFVSADGVCRMLDFGVSKIASDRRRTATGLLKGKLPYMAPEQLHGERADARADIWALGVMLWESLAGQRLFDRDTDFLTSQAIIDAPIPSVNAIPGSGSPRYPAAIDHVIARALGRDRDARTPTARDFARDLSRVAAGVGGAATREQIADAVAHLCGDQLASRRRAIAAAIARASPSDAPHAAASPPPPEAAETISMLMRREAIVVDRPRRRWPTAALALAAAAALAGIVAWRALADRPPSAAAAGPTAQPATERPSTPSQALAHATADRPSTPSHATGQARAERSSVEAAHPGAQRSVAVAPPAESPGPPAAKRPSSMAKPSGRATADRSPPTPRAPAQPPADDAPPGWYAIDSDPYATIFIDDRKVGDTPLDRIQLPAGRHRVRAVLPDGRQRSITIDIAPDRKTSSGTLTW